jgi:hypothetical protein
MTGCYRFRRSGAGRACTRSAQARHRERRHVGGPLGSQIVLLGAVGGEVIEFPGALVARANELQVARSDGGVALVFPEQRVAAQRLVSEGRHEARARERRRRSADPGRGRRGPGHVEAGRHHVDHVRGL